MENKRVLLVESGYFIGGVIHNLFESNDNLTVIETHPENGQALINSVRRHQPDVIVLDDTVKFDCMDDLLAYLRKSDRFRIVIVNTSSNHIDVYQKQQISVRQSSDLFEMI